MAMGWMTGSYPCFKVIAFRREATMKACITAAVICAALIGCGQQQAAAPQAPVVSAPPPAPVKDHNYVMQDGMKYGYPAAISEVAGKSGQVAEQLVMALYAGEKDGKHQAHIMDGVTVTALECTKPCDYLKVMTYVDADYLRNKVKVEHIAAAKQSLGYLIMEDAIRGKLKQYGMGIEGKRYNMWVDERKGMQRTLMPKS